MKRKKEVEEQTINSNENTPNVVSVRKHPNESNVSDTIVAKTFSNSAKETSVKFESIVTVKEEPFEPNQSHEGPVDIVIKEEISVNNNSIIHEIAELNGEFVEASSVIDDENGTANISRIDDSYNPNESYGLEPRSQRFSVENVGEVQPNLSNSNSECFESDADFNDSAGMIPMHLNGNSTARLSAVPSFHHFRSNEFDPGNDADVEPDECTEGDFEHDLQDDSCWSDYESTIDKTFTVGESNASSSAENH